MEISRRSFIKGVVALAGGLTSLANENNENELGMSRKDEKKKIREYMETAKLNRDWDRAIKENELREELASIIGEHTWVTYRIQEGNSLKFNRIIGKKILGADLPVENLIQLRKYLLAFRDRVNYLSINLGTIYV